MSDKPTRRRPQIPKADVYYTAKGPRGWQAKVRINDVTINDQFMPALDFDSSGNLVVTFYDRRDDPNNLLYHLYMAHIDSNGTRLEPTSRVSNFQSQGGIPVISPASSEIIRMCGIRLVFQVAHGIFPAR